MCIRVNGRPSLALHVQNMRMAFSLMIIDGTAHRAPRSINQHMNKHHRTNVANVEPICCGCCWRKLKWHED